ncbi:MAG: DnaB-like helicase N-terminal domain-containing protein, partial [Nannocystaceae bacterium]
VASLKREDFYRPAHAQIFDAMVALYERSEPIDEITVRAQLRAEGKLEPREHPVDALARELIEEWGPVARHLRVGPVAEVLHHVYPPPGPQVLLLVYHVDASMLGPADAPLETLGLRPEPGVRVAAFARGSRPGEGLLAADRAFVSAVRDGRVVPPATDPARPA